MRIFIALLFPKAIKDQLYEYVKNLEDKFPGNFTSYNNLHLTLYYIGEVDEVQLDKIKEAIKSINYNSFSFEIDSIGSFKNSAVHRLVHIKITPSINLKTLHQRVINALNLSGIKIQSTDFTPHITLGRKIKISIEELNDILTDKLNVLASRISIMESKRVNGVLVYEELDYQLLQEKKH